MATGGGRPHPGLTGKMALGSISRGGAGVAGGLATPRRSPTLAPAALAWSEAHLDAQGRSTGHSPLLLVSAMAGIADVAVIFGLSVAAFILRHGLAAIPADILLTSALATLLGVNTLYLSGAYALRPGAGVAIQAGRVIQAWTVVFVLLLVIGYLSKTLEDYSRLWAVTWYVSVAVSLILVRVAAQARLRRLGSRGRLASTLAVVDLCGRGQDFARKLVRSGADVRLLGVFSPSAKAVPGSAPDAPPGRGLDDLVTLAGLFRVDDVLVLVSGETTANVPVVLRLLSTIPANIRLCPVLPELAHAPIREAGLMHDHAVLTVHHRPLGGWKSMFKRIEDLLLGSVAAVLLAPLLLLIAALVKLDSSGPVLFRQARQGFNNNVIIVLKFRTMVHRREEEQGVPQATRDDKRVTRLGRILRRTSLDELPQIFNVLLGDMSLVGPRPHAVAHNQHYSGLIDDYLGRHRVQPGITGWAQVNGLRGRTDTLDKMQRRVEHDLAYIDNWSVFLDLQIMVLTVFSVLFDRESAY